MAEKILIADDEREITELIALYLENEHFTVFQCHTAQEALDCIDKECPDLAILDVMLPDRSGFEICKRIRREYTFPVIMLTAKIAEVTAASEQAADSLKEVEKRLTDMTLLIKNINTYQKTKPVYAAYRKAKDKEKYRAAHESDIILHEAAAKAIKAAGITKLPSLAALQAEYAALQEQKEALYADYGKLKKQVKEYDVIKRNIDSILRRESEPERGKENVRG